MDPLMIGAIVAGLAAGGAKIYGAYQEDQQASRDKARSLEREALADRRQQEQDRIAEQERRRQLILQAIARGDQQRQRSATLWRPGMARQQGA